jgi:methionyl-tRNA synthetase
MILSYADKYLFQNKKTCNQCLNEREGKSSDKKSRYRCRAKNSSRPEREYFIEKRYFSSESTEFLKTIEKEGYTEKSGKRKRSIIRKQKGLTEKDISKLCPKTYTLLKK